MPEPVEIATADAARRWRMVAIGLLIVGATDIANTSFNGIRLASGSSIRPVVCVAAINDPELVRRAMSNLPAPRAKPTAP